MGRYQITHTRKDGADADRRIDGVKIGAEYFPIDNIIGWINRREHTFFVSVQGRTVDVIVRVHPTSNRYYLTTDGDSFPPNNLLALPNC